MSRASFFTASDGARLAYELHASPASSKAAAHTLVLLHGWSGSRRYFDAALPFLRDSFPSVVALDLRWHGDSVAGSPPGGCSHVARLAADLHALLEAGVVEGRVLLCGASMGAAVAWSYAELFGQRRLAGIVVVDQSPFQNASPSWSLGSKGCYDAASLAALQAALLADLGRFADDNARCCFSLPADVSDATKNLCKAETLRCDPSRLGALMADHTSLDWRPLLPTLTVPILALHGGASGCFPPEGCAVVAAMAPRGDAICMEVCGHWLYIEKPAVFAAHVASFASRC